MNLDTKQHLLVFRFSSLGDVAMTVPIVKLLLEQHPHLTITMVSTGFMKPLFDGMERLEFYVADIKGRHKGLTGMYRLYKELSGRYSPDAVADLHDVIRTKVLRSFYYLGRKRVAVIDKGRKEKKELTRPRFKELRPLKSTFQRYADVFANLGYALQLDVEQGTMKKPLPPILKQLRDSGKVLIGIAPFALHKEKTYPPQRMKQLISLLDKNDNIRIFLLGGKGDARELESWVGSYCHLESWAGKMNFENELSHIAALHLVVSMDSANMHLASLFGVPVVSVWGGTHPYLGFYGWGQDPENAVQVDLDCRPSSVFGNKPCRNHGTCLDKISPIVIFERIIRQLNLEHYEVSIN